MLQRQEPGSLPIFDSQNAVRSLARYGYPFAGLLRILPPEDRPIEGLVREHEGRSLPSLTELFGARRKRAGELLQALAADPIGQGQGGIAVATAADWYTTGIG